MTYITNLFYNILLNNFNTPVHDLKIWLNNFNINKF